MKNEFATVGIRELRNNLSRYVERARAGEVIAVTDHGTEVALLVPRGRKGHEGLWARVAEGSATWGGGHPGRPTFTIESAGGGVVQEVIDDRDDRLR